MSTTTHPKGIIGKGLARSRYLAHRTRSIPCLMLGHDRVEWDQCPSLSMCSRCHTSWTEVKTPSRTRRS